MAKEHIFPGQRWISDPEPEMGLGIILKVEFGRVEIYFPAASEHRQYAIESAPLRRVRFAVGDKITTHDGKESVVEKAGTRQGLMVYVVEGGREVAEAELSDSISFSKPEDRMLRAHVDGPRTFDLRVEALGWMAQIRKSPVRGFVGPRIDLIPHQLSIAGEVASRLAPRVLLADEVGLGKTIEAGLILHRLHLTGRASRILVLVPEPLIHQWFVELLRRFNLLFSLFDEERCAAIEAGDAGANPFLDSQLVLCGLDLFENNPERIPQILEAEWDLLVVDEAHHLEWTKDGPGEDYLLVEALAEQTPGLLLLTATPQQLRPEGHFARLRLLDPERYSDLDAFLEETSHYGEVAAVVGRLLDGGDLTAADRALFAEKSARITAQADALAGGDASARARLVDDLVDEFGTGRVMFRNTRGDLTGFPERKAFMVPLDGEDAMAAKIGWLVAFLAELGENEKVLLIGKTRQLAEAVSEELLAVVQVKAALFHEDLNLMQRDRNAAYFAEEDGARILICSEIGSEGRNFQFAHHLVLFDLPDDPGLLEQRIGRLDRIGQSATVQIRVPFIKGSADEVLAKWYHDGLGAFERSLHGAAAIVDAVGDLLERTKAKPSASAMKALVKRSREVRAEVARRLERGHDRLLALNSRRPEEAAAMIAAIRAADSDDAFEEFLLRLFDHFGLGVEDLDEHTYLVTQGNVITDAFPALPDDGLAGTFDRTRALSREDIGFFSWDHPVVLGALDLLLGSEAGNAAFAVWDQEERPEGALLEAYVVIECVAPPALHADRFLPATPLRVVVNHALDDHSENEALREASLHSGEPSTLFGKAVFRKKLVPQMLDKAKSLAKKRVKAVVAQALADARSQLDDEIARLESLQALNDNVSPAEVAALRDQKEALCKAIGEARLRIDALRVIHRVQTKPKVVATEES